MPVPRSCQPKEITMLPNGLHYKKEMQLLLRIYTSVSWKKSITPSKPYTDYSSFLYESRRAVTPRWRVGLALTSIGLYACWNDRPVSPLMEVFFSSALNRRRLWLWLRLHIRSGTLRCVQL